jgi:hypothetical protein
MLPHKGGVHAPFLWSSRRESPVPVQAAPCGRGRERGWGERCFLISRTIQCVEPVPFQLML